MGGSCSVMEEKKEEINEVLEIHNKKREKHKCSSLKINDDLNKLAKECVRIISKGNTFSQNYYQGVFLGENIYIVKGRMFCAQDMCDAWYEEIKKYDKSLNEYQKNTSHFTQMVWKETKEIGFAYRRVKNVIYAVVYYYPPGNTSGEYKDNVLFPD